MIEKAKKWKQGLKYIKVTTNGEGKQAPTTESTVKEMKADITNSSHASRQVVASVPGSGTPIKSRFSHGFN